MPEDTKPMLLISETEQKLLENALAVTGRGQIRVEWDHNEEENFHYGNLYHGPRSSRFAVAQGRHDSVQSAVIRNADGWYWDWTGDDPSDGEMAGPFSTPEELVSYILSPGEDEESPDRALAP